LKKVTEKTPESHPKNIQYTKHNRKHTSVHNKNIFVSKYKRLVAFHTQIPNNPTSLIVETFINKKC